MIEDFIEALKRVLFDLFAWFTAYAIVRKLEDLRMTVTTVEADVIAIERARRRRAMVN